MVGRSGPAVYIGLLSAEERKSRAALASLAKAQEQARQVSAIAKARQDDIWMISAMAILMWPTLIPHTSP